jgi:hypothetical protein
VCIALTESAPVRSHHRNGPPGARLIASTPVCVASTGRRNTPRTRPSCRAVPPTRVAPRLRQTMSTVSSSMVRLVLLDPKATSREVVYMKVVGGFFLEPATAHGSPVAGDCYGHRVIKSNQGPMVMRSEHRTSRRCRRRSPATRSQSQLADPRSRSYGPAAPRAAAQTTVSQAAHRTDSPGGEHAAVATPTARHRAHARQPRRRDISATRRSWPRHAIS